MRPDRNQLPSGARVREIFDYDPLAARIRVRKRMHHIGSFATADEAGAAYLAKARESFGEFARS